MANLNFQKTIKEFLNLSGIQINGNNPWDIKIHDNRFYQKVFAEGSLGLGESYMDKWWDCERLDEFFYKILKMNLDKKIKNLKLFLEILCAKFFNLFFNLQSKKYSKKVVERHYDLGNELYESMLDKNMQYTCGYWKNAEDLDTAQENKLKLICEKLKLKSGMKILELGGGFGGLAKYIAEKYKCSVVSYNISKEQIKYGRKICKNLPVKFIEADYREAEKQKEKFDKVVSVGLMEHVGPKNYRNFIQLGKKCLKGDLFLIHTIGSNITKTYGDPWIKKYIFPGGHLPSIKQISKAAEKLFIIEDLHNFGIDYYKTLIAWNNNFQNSWNELHEKNKKKYNERFKRMWEYYLLSCAGAFKARRIQLWQIILSKSIKGYKSIR